MSISYICQTCKVVDREVEVCSKCHSALYCSRNCQQLDWKSHKRFCNESDKELAISRREVCLKIINSYPNCIFRYLFLQKSFQSPGCLIVGEETLEPIYVGLGEHMELIKNQLNLPEEVLNHIESVIKKTVQIELKNIICKGIPVLYGNNKIYSVYVVGSENTLEEIKGVEKLPKDLVTEIITKLRELREKTL